MIKPEQALLANALAEKAVLNCDHTLIDNGSDWCDGKSLGAACEKCIEQTILEVMEHPT